MRRLTAVRSSSHNLAGIHQLADEQLIELEERGLLAVEDSFECRVEVDHRAVLRVLQVVRLQG